MRLVKYTPEYFDALRRAAARIGPTSNLCHRPFVDYYYASRDGSQLYLVLDEAGNVVATQGVERMNFRYFDREISLGFGTNYFTLRPGMGVYLFLQWMKSCPIPFVLGGSDDTHRILRAQRWTYFAGIRDYTLNPSCECYPGEPQWRRATKSILRVLQANSLKKYALRIPHKVQEEISVREEEDFGADLLPRESPFTFRFTPTLEYMRWRYNTKLSFVRYRLFRILRGTHTVGYVILNHLPNQILVAQSDGHDVKGLAHGVLLSLLNVGRETGLLPRASVLSSHPEMQRIFERFGFKREKRDRPFALMLAHHQVDMRPDTSNWLVNLDWGDNGLRVPFLDQFAGQTSL